MILTDKLETICRKCHIIKEFAPLPESILGYYYCDGNYYVILINESIRDDEKLYRCVLAEEIGHYRTTIGDITPRKYMCYRDRLTVDKMEQLALRWATDFMVPTDMLIDTLRKRLVQTLDDLVEYFQVTNEFILHKLRFMSKQNCLWDIDGKRRLYLANFPSLHICERI